MPVNATSSINSATGSAQDGGITPFPTQTLTQEDFLQLLMAQLQAQDPMNPMSDTQFVAQMATFTTLEQSKQMIADIQQLRTQQQLLQANDLIGRTVMLQEADGTMTTGTVSGVLVQDGAPSIVVNSQAYDLGALLAIAPASTNAQTEGAQS